MPEPGAAIAELRILCLPAASKDILSGPLSFVPKTRIFSSLPPSRVLADVEKASFSGPSRASRGEVYVAVSALVT